MPDDKTLIQKLQNKIFDNEFCTCWYSNTTIKNPISCILKTLNGIWTVVVSPLFIITATWTAIVFWVEITMEVCHDWNKTIRMIRNLKEINISKSKYLYDFVHVFDHFFMIHYKHFNCLIDIMITWSILDMEWRI